MEQQGLKQHMTPAGGFPAEEQLVIGTYVLGLANGVRMRWLRKRAPSLRIAYKFASRSRPANFLRALTSIVGKSHSNCHFIHCTLDLDDPSLPEYQRVVGEMASRTDIRVSVGTSHSKVDAINRGLDELGEWDVLVNMSDDMLFTYDGYDQIVRSAFRRGLDRFVHFNDGWQYKNVCTLSVVGRAYFERDGYIYHPDYKTVWCDVEATEVAILRGKYTYMGDRMRIFDHLHPAWNLAKNDDLNLRNDAPQLELADKKVYMLRKARRFDCAV